MVVEFKWSETRGEPWDDDDDDELARRLPRLAALYTEPPDRAS
jgi:hypothetical protein